MTGKELHDALVEDGFLPCHLKTRIVEIDTDLTARQEKVSRLMRLIKRFRQIFRK